MASGVDQEPASLIKVKVEENNLMAELVGEKDCHLKQVEKNFKNTKIVVRGNEIALSGEDAYEAAKTFEELLSLIKLGNALDEANIDRTIRMVKHDEAPSEVLSKSLFKSSRGKSVRPKTSGQRKYVDAISQATITVAIGPAGTGKSYLAVAMALAEFQSRKVNRIILTRPAVEAGERLGFLPGDLMAKVDPYLRPLYDALLDLLDVDGMQKLIDRQLIEVAPLAYMRGRTLNNSFVILDEAQNTTPEQMKMFLTRIGFGSKAVITGDITQIDVPGGATSSGLVGLDSILSGINGISFIYLTKDDVVRNPIVAQIIDAYEKASS